MPAAKLPTDETDRLKALRGYEILDTQSEQAFDDLALLAAAVCDCPTALVSLLDTDRQWFKAKVGLDVDETPREHAFCGHAILDKHAVTVVPDASEDDRFSDNPYVVNDPHVRFYAGAPLVTSAGHAIGTLCVIDDKPRQLDERQREALQALSRQVRVQLDLRSALGALRRAQENAQRYQSQLEATQSRLEEANRQLEEQSVTDALTGLYNRRALNQQLNQALAQAARHDRPLSVLLVDVDHFKPYNDTFGHLAGDDALKRVAQILHRTARKTDVVARYGGEEFAVLLPETNTVDALVLAERFRAGIADERWIDRAITISLGLASRQGTGANCKAEEILAEADKALYQAKTSGRNRVMMFLQAGAVTPRR